MDEAQQSVLYVLSLLMFLLVLQAAKALIERLMQWLVKQRRQHQHQQLLEQLFPSPNLP